MENLGEGNTREGIMYSKRIGIRNYTLVETKETQKLIEEIILSSSNKLNELLRDKENLFDEERIKLVIQAVSLASIEHMKSGLSVFRVFLGGDYKLEDVINAVSCIDASLIIKIVLERGYGISSEIETIRLGIVNDHHYLRVKPFNVSNQNVNNQKRDQEIIIDPILRSKRNPAVIFYSDKDHKRLISNFNSLGLKGIVRQIFRLVKPRS